MLNIIADEVRPTRTGFVTNYPDFRQWRREAGVQGLGSQPMNVYLHFPYCIQRCAYCHYKTTTLGSAQLGDIDRYVNAICREIEIAQDRFHLRERPTISLYFGGGTPTLLNAVNIDRILRTLRDNLTLEDPEINFEAEPVSLTPHKAEFLKQHGVNRLSVGIQSFCDEIVFRTGRRDTEQQALKAVETALSTGAVVNVDLISGLLGETPETWAYSIRRAIESGSHCITVYKLEIYANTDYYAQLRRQNISLPSEDDELQLARYALDELTGAGYHPVNFFTFARDTKYMQRHVTTKWQGTDVCAFGASAFGSLGNWSYQNTNDLESYSNLLQERQLPVFRGYAYNSLELMTRDVILGMKLIRFDRAAFRKRHGLDLTKLCAPDLTRLEETGFLTIDDESILLTRKGILYGDYVGRVLAASLEMLAAQSG